MNAPTNHSPSAGWPPLRQPLKKETVQDGPSQRQGMSLQSERADSDHTDITYWRSQLSSPLPVLELPTRQGRSALSLVATVDTATVDTATVDTYSLRLSPSLCDRLKAIGQSNNATLFMTLLAAFKALIYRYTGQTDILIGASERTAETTAETTTAKTTTAQQGHPLPLRLSLTDEATFLTLLDQVREVALAAQAHQSAPYAKIIEALQQGYGPDRASLFQIQFSLDSTPYHVSDTPAGSGEAQPLAQPFTASELSLHLCSDVSKFLGDGAIATSPEPDSTGLVCNFSYKTNLFDSATIRRLAGHFQTLLEGIVAAPEQPLATLPLLTAPERHQQLNEWNSALASAGPAGHEMNHRCLHELFERQVAIAPEAIAVVFENERLSYQELNRRANQLAHHLRSLGVGPEVPVGLCVERSARIVIAILAILKAGGAYVPLDPTTPQARLNFILSDSQMSVLITETAWASVLSAQESDEFPSSTLQVVNLETDNALISRQSQENPNSSVSPQNLAYIIYTSGTTGRPKGVLSQHFNATRLFSATEQWFNFSDQDVWTLFHSYAFDFSVWEIWGALLYGGRLVVVPYAIARWPKMFYQLLATEQVTVLNQTPSAFRQVMRVEETLATTQPLALRWVIFGGEALDLQCLRPWFERHGDVPQLVNMYGITETTVHVTYRPICLADLSSQGSVIGRPIPDLQLYILDQHQQLLPIGVPGELYVGGAGLARGYLNRPELSAEKFIPSPFSPSSPSSTDQQSHQRLYKTGDLACYRPDGDIEYLGRIDHQVKIRGFRIELGEIEARLSQLPQVSAATVMVREDIEDDQRLVAYIVPSTRQLPAARNLRTALKESLPDYMVPAAYVMLEALPLTANGKIDRKALLALPLEQPVLSDEFAKPRTAVEKQLARLWCKFLNLEQVGIFDSFFELGGHSLLATQMVSQVEETFQQSLSLAEFFQAPTIAAQANLLEGVSPEDQSATRWSSLLPMQAVIGHNQAHETSPLPALFCVHGGGGSVLMYQALARHLSDCFRLYGLQSSYLNNPEKLLTTVEEMVQLYLHELRSVQSEGPYLIGGYCGGAPIALEMVQQLQAAGETVALLALFDPVSIQVDLSPLDRPLDRPVQQFTVVERVRSLLNRLDQHGPKIIVQGRWLKTIAWIYQRMQRPLTLAMRSVIVQAANVQAMRTYVATESYAGPAAIYIPKQGINPKGGMTEGWKDLLTGEVSVHAVPGNHHFDESTDGSFFHEPAVRTLAIRLKESIAEALK